MGALSLLLALAGCGPSGGTSGARPNTQAAASSSDPSTPSGVTAHGVGRVTGAPDVMTLTIGVQSTAAHAGDALSANATRANAVIATLKSHGVANADIQTSQLSLYPQYDNNGNTIGGYQVTNTVTAKLHDVTKAGGAIDAAVAAAGDAGRLQGVSFSFNDDSSLLVRARADAVAAAKTQAQQLADASGAKLGTLRSLSEDVTRSSPVPYAQAAGVADSAATPVQAGSQELTVAVTAIWNLA
ncbi:MAG: uncharacterized protein QOF20_2819 [Acidimicrobiaceae bacterium]|jgi:uncharacterized protein YggE|nr:uncharacterized protein [Acidimicrobiaceae bacterium]